MKIKYCLASFAIICIQTFISASIYAHCQLPCGIYDDHARVKMLIEDSNFITKSINEINTLAKKNDSLSKNQLTRWVMNKEKHASHIIEVITDYFLTQRIKPSQKDYKERLTKHHVVILKAVTVKQTVDNNAAVELSHVIYDLLDFYPESSHHH